MTVVQQPDISYHPDRKKFQQRTERIKARQQGPPSLPVDFPTQLDGPLVWEGKQWTNEDDWTFSLNGDQLTEIHEALLHFKCM